MAPTRFSVVVVPTPQYWRFTSLTDLFLSFLSSSTCKRLIAFVSNSISSAHSPLIRHCAYRGCTTPNFSTSPRAAPAASLRRTVASEHRGQRDQTLLLNRHRRNALQVALCRYRGPQRGPLVALHGPPARLSRRPQYASSRPVLIFPSSRHLASLIEASTH